MGRKPRLLTRLLLVPVGLFVVDASARLRGADEPAPAPAIPVSSPNDVDTPPAVPALPDVTLPPKPLPPESVAIEKLPSDMPRSAFEPVGEGLDLRQCLDIACARQPAVKAAQCSLAASTRGYLSLWNLRRTAELLSPDLPLRRKQAEKGIAVATAEVLKVQYDVNYDVSRMYYSFIYARQQEQTASNIIEELDLFYKVLEDTLKAGGVPNKKLDQFTLYALEDAISKIRKLRDKAVLGQKQALYALKEAMGVEPTFAFVPKDTELPVMSGTVTQEQVIEMAVTRRGELAQAALAVDVFRLEVCAQSALKHRTVSSTFAQGSDLHARLLPHPIRNGEYRPGAVPPEMPSVLVGTREDRVARASALSSRQDAVYEKALGLIRLEAINSYLNWQATGERVMEAKKRYERSRKLVEEARAAAATKQDPELLVRQEALSGESQAEYLEAVFKHVEALIHMEKVTAGGVVPAFPGR